MREKVLEIIRRHDMIQEGETVYVGVSGGQDSVALLDFLSCIKDELKFKLGIIHVNHMLREGDSDKDEYFVNKLASKYKVPIRIEKIDVESYAKAKKLSLEDAARKCRYYCFLKVAKEANIDKVAIGHMKDDNAETVLMRLLRGTGLKGLRAIQPVLTYQGVNFIRPFIDTEKTEVEEYSKKRKLRFRLDMSNYSLDFTRNRIRHELIPHLENEYNPQIKQCLSRLTESVHADYAFLESFTDSEYQKVLKKEKKGLVVLDKKKVTEYHPAIQYRLVLKAAQVLYPGLSLKQMYWVGMGQALKEDGKFSASIGKDIQVDIKSNEIVVASKRDRLRYEYFIYNEENLMIREFDLDLSFRRFERPNGMNLDIPTQDSCEYFDADKLRFPLTIRNRKNGDRMMPLGMQGEKKIKDILIDKKVPNYLRDELPLILSEDKVVWCWGIGISEQYKITDDTQRYVQVSITQRNEETPNQK